MSPKEAVERKLIAKPALLIGQASGISETELDSDNDYITVKTIIDNFEYN